eukprot:1551158-Rhodomonas_salina.2
MVRCTARRVRASGCRASLAAGQGVGIRAHTAECDEDGCERLRLSAGVGHQGAGPWPPGKGPPGSGKQGGPRSNAQTPLMHDNPVRPSGSTPDHSGVGEASGQKAVGCCDLESDVNGAETMLVSDISSLRVTRHKQLPQCSTAVLPQ